MKRLLILVVSLVVFPLSGWAKEAPTSHVTTAGFATVAAEADQLRWQLQVKTRGSAVAEVSGMHAERVAKALDFLKKPGLDELTTSSMRLVESWTHKNNSRVRDGYLATTTISLVQNDLGLYLDIWKGLSVLEDVQILDARFAVRETDKLEEQARVAAVKNAREKAVSMAAAVGACIGEPLFIKEPENPRFAPATAMFDASIGQKAAQPISPGKIEIRAEIRASFRLYTP